MGDGTTISPPGPAPQEGKLKLEDEEVAEVFGVSIDDVGKLFEEVVNPQDQKSIRKVYLAQAEMREKVKTHIEEVATVFTKSQFSLTV
jgi:hypothetical protein